MIYLNLLRCYELICPPDSFAKPTKKKVSGITRPSPSQMETISKIAHIILPSLSNHKPQTSASPRRKIASSQNKKTNQSHRENNQSSPKPLTPVPPKTQASIDSKLQPPSRLQKSDDIEIQTEHSLPISQKLERYTFPTEKQQPVNEKETQIMLEKYWRDLALQNPNLSFAHLK